MSLAITACTFYLWRHLHSTRTLPPTKKESINRTKQKIKKTPSDITRRSASVWACKCKSAARPFSKFQRKYLHKNKLQLLATQHWIRYLNKKRKTRPSWTNISYLPPQNKIPCHIWHLFHRISSNIVFFLSFFIFLCLICCASSKQTWPRAESFLLG